MAVVRWSSSARWLSCSGERCMMTTKAMPLFGGQRRRTPATRPVRPPSRPGPRRASSRSRAWAPRRRSARLPPARRKSGDDFRQTVRFASGRRGGYIMVAGHKIDYYLICFAFTSAGARKAQRQHPARESAARLRGPVHFGLATGEHKKHGNTPDANYPGPFVLTVSADPVLGTVQTHSGRMNCQDSRLVILRHVL